MRHPMLVDQAKEEQRIQEQIIGLGVYLLGFHVRGLQMNLGKICYVKHKGLRSLGVFTSEERLRF